MYVGKGEVDEITFSLKVSARRSLRTQTAGNTSAFTNHYEVTIKKMNTNKRRTKKVLISILPRRMRGKFVEVRCHYKHFVPRWSYGVILWEIATLGKIF